MPLPAWATQKIGPIPLWGWDALVAGGGVAAVLYRRRQASSTTGPAGAGGQQAFAGYPSNADAGGAPGGFGGGAGQPVYGDLLRWLNSGADAGGSSVAPASSTTTTPATGGTSALAPAPSSPAVQIAPSLLGGGYQASSVQLQNPLGSADRAAAASGGSYAPSLTDYATEQTGGIQVVQAGLPGTQPSQGLTYTIYGTNTGSGDPMAANQRIAGERYDLTGRRIL